MDRLKVGLIGASFPNFAAEQYSVYPRAVAALEKLATEWDFDLVTVTKPVQTAEQAETARRQLEDAGADFLLVQASSFAMGDVILPLARMDVPLGLWAVPEPSLDGEIPLNSFTGFNMFASIVRLNLPERRFPFKWFYGEPDDDRFRRRLRLTVQALTTLKRLRQTRIALIGDIAPTFYNFAYNADSIAERLGVRVEQRSLDEVFERVPRYETGQVSALVTEMAGRAADVAVSRDWLELTGRVVLAIRDLADQGSYSALALRCFPEFQSELGGFGPCAAVSWLNDTGLVTSCEGDVLGALSMLALHFLSNEPTTLLDLVAVVEAEGQGLVQFWHCGPTAASLADEAGLRLIYHPTLDRASPPGKPPSGAAADLVLAPGPATIMRFSSGTDRAFLMTGDIVEGPTRGYDGSRGWLSNLRINGERASIPDLMETMAYHGLPHHYPLALGEWAETLRELAGWSGIDILERIPYQDHLVSPLLPSE